MLRLPPGRLHLSRLLPRADAPRQLHPREMPRESSEGNAFAATLAQQYAATASRR